VGWALGCDDLETAVASARSRGFDPGGVLDGQRLRPDGTLLRWQLTGNALIAALAALVSDVKVRLASEPAIMARIAGPRGEQELR
jgi:glyoxalase-like protein